MNLRDIFFITTVVAAYLGLRHAAIAFEEESFIGCGILGIGITVSIYGAIRNLKSINLFLLPGLTTLLFGSSRAMECVHESPGTYFLRKHPIPAQYVVDPEINLIGLVAGTVVVTLVAGTTGFVFKFLYVWAKSKSLPIVSLNPPIELGSQGVISSSEADGDHL